MRKISSAFPTNSASGEIVVFADGADGIPAKKLTLNLSPHQSGSGDPSPDNVRPISGYTAVKVTRAGKNLLPIENYYIISKGITYTITSDGKIVANGTASEGASSFYFYGQTGRKYPAGRYILTGCPSGGGTNSYSIRQMTNNTYVGQDAGTGRTLEIAQNDTVYFYARIAANITVSNLVFEPMLRLASETDSTFEPCTNTTIPITFPTAAETVYGGSLIIDQDGSGELVVDRGFANLTGGSNEIWRESTTSYYCRLDSAVFGGNTPASNRSDIICNRFIGVQTGTAGLAIGKNAFPDTVTSLAECVAWVQANNIECVYPLAESQTYALTAEQVTTLLGDNTIFMDVDGTIDLAYRADTTLYLNSLITGIRNNIAYIEDGTTASRAYSVGQYVLIGGQLYKVTASITSGATFTIGTNVTATTVGNELNALN